jgi:hypothetical protein
MKARKKIRSFTLEQETLDLIKKIAVQEQRSESQVVDMMILSQTKFILK